MKRAGIVLALVASGCVDPGLEFSDMGSMAVSATSASIVFTTSRETTAEVAFGMSRMQLDQRASDMRMMEPFANEHSVMLTELEPNTTYYWRGEVVDEQGRTYETPMASFTTGQTDGDARVNLSLMGRVMDVSSNFAGADAAIDGEMGTEWSSDGDGDDAYITVAWDAMQTITGVRVFGRRMMDGTAQISSFRVRNGMQDLGVFELPDAMSPHTFDFETAVTTASLRFEVLSSTGGDTGLRELQFLGQP